MSALNSPPTDIWRPALQTNKQTTIRGGLIFRAFRPFLEDIGQKRNIFASFTWFLDVKHIEVVKTNKDQHI